MSHSWSTGSWILCQFVVHKSPAVEFSGDQMYEYLQDIEHRKDGSTTLPQISRSTDTLSLYQPRSSSHKSHVFLSLPMVTNSASSERSANMMLYSILLGFLPALTSLPASCNADNCLHASDQIPSPQPTSITLTPQPLCHLSCYHTEVRFPDAVLRVL